MKKIYITTLLVSFSLAGMAQQKTDTYSFGSKQKLGPATERTSYKPTAPTHDQTKALNIVWSEDFSGGTAPLETSNGQYVAGGPNAAYWKIDASAHPLGSFGWTHALTGEHLTWDSYNPNSSEPNFATTPVSGEIVSPTISYTSTNSIGIRFNTETMYCCNFQELPFGVAVSIDNGATWSDTLTFDFGVERNEATEDIAHPLYYTANLDAYVPAGSQTQFKFKLIWQGLAVDPNGQSNTHYFWLLDDLELYEIPDNNIAITAGYHADVFTDWEYSRVAMAHTREMIPVAILENLGINAQTFDLSCTVDDGSGTVATATPISVTLAPGEIDTVSIPTGFTPSTLGTYTATLTIPADDDNANNTLVTSSLTVTSGVTGHDYAPGDSFGWDPAGTNSANADDPHGWGVIITPEVNDVIEGVDILWETGTTDNYLYAIQVQQIDPNGVGDWIQDPLLLLGQALYTVTPADIGTPVTITFSSGINVTAGANYIVEVQKVDGTSGVGFYIGSSETNGEDDDLATVGYGDYGATPGVTYFNNWGWSPYIRANFDAGLGVNETSLEGIAVYPNPSNGIINVSNANNEAIDVTVYDVAGNVITTQSSNGAAKLDLSTVGTGLYMVKVENGSGSMVERVVIK